MASNRSGFGSFVFGFLLALLVLFGAAFAYLRYGHPPVATADAAFPFEAQIVKVPLGARIAREQKTAPFPADEAVLQAGAAVYGKECASCHGTPGRDVPYAKYMYPQAPQLWKKHGKGVVGVSDDEVGESYWKVANGIRLTGMPSYEHVLSDAQMWQVAWLVKSADQNLSPAVTSTLAAANQ
jgi:mono/diheme cytochrome c family protein